MSGRRSRKNDTWDADDKATEEGRGSSGPGTRRSGVSEAKQKFLAAHQFGASVVEAGNGWLGCIRGRRTGGETMTRNSLKPSGRRGMGLVEGLEWEAFRRAIMETTGC